MPPCRGLSVARPTLRGHESKRLSGHPLPCRLDSPGADITGLLVWAIVAAGDGAGSCLGVAALVLLFTLPVLLIRLAIGILAIRRRSGTVPAIIAVTLNTTALAVSA